jgi:subtilisin family serine protease
MRLYIALRQKVAAALLATVVAIALPVLARGDDSGTTPEDVTPTLEVVTNDPTVQYAPGQLVVGLADDATRAEVRTAVEEAGASVERSINAIDTKVLEVPAGEMGDAIDSLEASPAVEYVQPDVVLEASATIPNDALWKEQWGPARVLAPQVWDATKGSPSVVVAVVDTGVDYSHPDLQGVFVPGFDLVNNDADPQDDQGHGTAVAGVIAARTQNRVGQAGMCWKCSVMPVKVLDRNGSGPTSTIAAGIVWAVNHGAQVINLSLGGAGTTEVLQDAVSFAASKGVLVLAAAGNSGSTTKFYPAAYPSVVSIAATQEDDTLYSWSNRGADWVQVAAPGCDTAPVRGGGYGNFCGTSAATPVVSGIAGLPLSLDPTITPDRFAQALRSAARKGIAGVEYGRVNALRTLAALGLVAPVNTSRPKIVGAASSGETLESRSGGWLGASSFTYRWQRCDREGKNCITLPTATAQNYQVALTDVGSTLRLMVRAANAHGSKTTFSVVTGVVKRGAVASTAGAVPEATPPASAPPPPSSGSAGTPPPPTPPPSPIPSVPPEVGDTVVQVTGSVEDVSSTAPAPVDGVP